MRAVLEAAKRQLTEKMKDKGTEGLTTLLARSFPYIGVPELRDIPLSIISQLHPVPPEFLSQLAKDKELFSDLPASVQNQVRFVLLYFNTLVNLSMAFSQFEHEIQTLFVTIHPD